MPQILKLLRQKRGPAVAVEAFEGFGAVLRPADDPDGIVISDAAYKSIRMEPDFPKLPKELMSRIVSLYIWLMEKRPNGSAGGTPDSAREVSVVLLRDVETMKRWRVLVPRQVVGGASVEADFTKGLCDIETGEEITEWPPAGWSHAGSSHSHNNMRAFFSGTDDRSELPVPGVHFVCGHFVKKDDKWSYEIAPSIVYKRTRYEKVADGAEARDMEWDDILDASSAAEEHHAKVLDYVSVETPKVWDSAAFRANAGKGGTGRLWPHDYEDDAWGFGYGLGDGSPYDPELQRDAINRYYAETARYHDYRDTPLARRVCLIPLEGLFLASPEMQPGRDGVSQFRAWVQEEPGISTMAEKNVYRQKDGSLWTIYKYGNKDEPVTWMRVEESDKGIIKHAKHQRRLAKKREKPDTPAPVIPALIGGVPTAEFAGSFTEEEIVALCMTWART